MLEKNFEGSEKKEEEEGEGELFTTVIGSGGCLRTGSSLLGRWRGVVLLFLFFVQLEPHERGVVVAVVVKSDETIIIRDEVLDDGIIDGDLGLLLLLLLLFSNSAALSSDLRVVRRRPLSPAVVIAVVTVGVDDHRRRVTAAEVAVFEEVLSRACCCCR
jgi:hypothetical protein